MAAAQLQLQPGEKVSGDRSQIILECVMRLQLSLAASLVSALLIIFPSPVKAQRNCSKEFLENTASGVRNAQANLLAFKVRASSLGFDLPAPLQMLIRTFKEALTQASDLYT